MSFKGSYYSDNVVNSQLYEEENGKPDSTFLEPVANGPKSLDKIVLKIMRRNHVFYEAVSSACVVGISVRTFLCI